ncbi:hypothetical protein SBRCBS47491_000749 [Sporothrix bragantina]|uniref:CFEM domain-containing protein n=1 Tax=Sporothrix bragantina TaxID=671064 RepID=A0ABP0ASZ1_9PEZI
MNLFSLIPTVFAVTALAASSPTSQSPSTTATPTTTSSPSSSETSLTALIAAVPGCALGCLALVSVNLGCAATDLTCVCRSSTDASASLAAQVGACLLQGCNGTSDLGAVESLAPRICAQASTAGSSVLSMVSTEIAAELSTAAVSSSTNTKTGAKATGTTSGTKATSTPAAGAAPPAGTRATMALLGIGGVAVLAVYAL